MPAFSRYIGIDYSGASTADASLPGLRVYVAESAGSSAAPAPVEILPPRSAKKYWTRRTLAEWLLSEINQPQTVLVGIDHAFSFPLAYFDRHGLPRDWRLFLDDFAAHWPTDAANVTVDFVREGFVGQGAARSGRARWRRRTELRCKRAKSVFHFDVTGQVAKSTHAGLPWLRFILRQASRPAHVWPFDGWSVPDGTSVLAEVYPALISGAFAREGRTGDQHDAYAIAAWLAAADREGSLQAAFRPAVSETERIDAGIEGWILGVW